MKRNVLTIQWPHYILAACAMALIAAPGARASTSGGEGHGASESAAEVAVESDEPIRGVSLGEFRIRAYHPIEAKRSTLMFTLYAVVSSENASDFKELLGNRRHKVRDQAITVSRMVSLAELDQPQLTSFRRRMLLRLRRTMPELEIDDLYISDFQLEVRGI